MSMTLVEKILARASGRAEVKVGDVVEPRVDLAMSHENAAGNLPGHSAAGEDLGSEPGGGHF
jgi:homoaconitase/3-isopropylmalate dehydratase large subunit